MTTPEDPRIEAVETALKRYTSPGHTNGWGAVQGFGMSVAEILAVADAADPLRAALRGDLPAPTDDGDTPEQLARAAVERNGSDKYDDGRPKYHRHFASYEVHEDGTCTGRGSPRRVYVFDAEDLDAHERFISARVAAAVGGDPT